MCIRVTYFKSEIFAMRMNPASPTRESASTNTRQHTFRSGIQPDLNCVLFNGLQFASPMFYQMICPVLILVAMNVAISLTRWRKTETSPNSVSCLLKKSCTLLCLNTYHVMSSFIICIHDVKCKNLEHNHIRLLVNRVLYNDDVDLLHHHVYLVHEHAILHHHVYLVNHHLLNHC